MKCSPCVNCIIHQPVCPEGNLQGVQQGSCDVLQLIQHQSLEGFHDYGYQGNGHVVIQPFDVGVLFCTVCKIHCRTTTYYQLFVVNRTTVEQLVNTLHSDLIMSLSARCIRQSQSEFLYPMGGGVVLCYIL